MAATRASAAAAADAAERGDAPLCFRTLRPIINIRARARKRKREKEKKKERERVCVCVREKVEEGEAKEETDLQAHRADSVIRHSGGALQQAATPRS